MRRSNLRPETTEWFLSERGITSDTLEAFGIREEDGAVIYPYVSHEKKRYGLLGGERKFYWPKGVDPELFNVGDLEYSSAFIVEGETDTMRLWQELGDAEVGVIGIPGVDSWAKLDLAADFAHVDTIWVILDNDEDYNVRGQVDTAWQGLRKALGRKAQRIYLPTGVKDVCDFFQSGGSLDTLRELVEAPETGRFHYQALDFDAPVPEYDWLVDEWVAKGDLVLLFGEPGLGKSIIAQSLAVAVAEQQSRWVGHELSPGSGRVLYVDEENPFDVIRNRLRDLGLKKGKNNIRYLHNQGIRLDRQADLLLDEAFSWEPELIVLDSLTRFHTKDENNAGEMGRLFNDGIRPLARETGAAVIVIHHAGKSESASSYNRARGSGDITGVVDFALDVKKVAHKAGQIRVVRSKTRRNRQGESFDVRIEENPLGGIRLSAAPHAAVSI